MINDERMENAQLQMLLARQAIYDKSGSVYAYELLYRNNTLESNITNKDEIIGVKATSSVIAQLFANMDIDSVISNKLAFINFTYTDLIQKVPLLLPKDRIVIEVLETVMIDQQLMANLKEFRKEGYKIALDDFIFKPELTELVEIADIIKLDVLNKTRLDILEQVNPLKGFKGKLLAEKIDNKEQFNHCLDLGFDYFQGFFLNKPDILKGQVISENTTLVLKVLTEINNENISYKALEKSILQIPTLSYRILRVANSAYYHSNKNVNSLTDAIFRIGLAKVTTWASLILSASNPETSHDLIEQTLIRAFMCEGIARTIKNVNPDEAYTVGIFSMLDGMLNEPLPSLLAKIHLDEILIQALLHYEGKLGEILKCVVAYQAGNFEELENSFVEQCDMSNLYLDGIKYANKTLNTVI